VYEQNQHTLSHRIPEGIQSGLAIREPEIRGAEKPRRALQRSPWYVCRSHGEGANHWKRTHPQPIGPPGDTTPIYISCGRTQY
jgi:hypothetical protein